MRTTLALILCLLLGSALAAPPPWAPAHGYRAKHGAAPPHAEVLDLETGRCHYERLGRILGGAIGGAVGSQVGDGDARTVAIIGGTVIGVLLGGKIGKSVDDLDRACAGQVLAHAPRLRPVAWTNTASGAEYVLTPLTDAVRRDGRLCRDYRTQVTVDGTVRRERGTACRDTDGVWQLSLR